MKTFVEKIITIFYSKMKKLSALFIKNKKASYSLHQIIKSLFEGFLKKTESIKALFQVPKSILLFFVNIFLDIFYSYFCLNFL